VVPASAWGEGGEAGTGSLGKSGGRIPFRRPGQFYNFTAPIRDGAPALSRHAGRNALPLFIVGNSGTSSHHFVHGHPQSTGTDALTNRPYKPCCRSADQSVANASAKSRENKMRTMMTGSCGGRPGAFFATLPDACGLVLLAVTVLANTSDDTNLFISDLLSVRTPRSGRAAKLAHNDIIL
jgi:hypothetical protein